MIPGTFRFLILFFEPQDGITGSILVLFPEFIGRVEYPFSSTTNLLQVLAGIEMCLEHPFIAHPFHG